MTTETIEAPVTLPAVKGGVTPYLTVNGAKKAADFYVKALGAENVLWAIDYPYQPTTPAVAFMDSAPISDADRHKIYHENAERVFHIAPAGAVHSHAGASSAR